MTEQENRARFFAKTGRIATSEPVEYQAFLWGIEAGRDVEREACAKLLDEVGATLQTEGKSDDFWEGVGCTVAAGEIAIWQRSNA